MIWTHLAVAGEIHDVRYSFQGGNFKAKVLIPDGNGPFPVIIYNYDQYYDWAGPVLAARRGYDLDTIMTEMSQWGYAVIIPLERYRKLSAIKGSIVYCKTQPELRADNIHLVGVAEGAFMSLLCLPDYPEIRSLCFVAPESIHDSGKLSLAQVLRDAPKVNTPILFVMATNDKTWKVRMAKFMYRVLNQSHQEMRLKEYDADRAWFFSADNIFMEDIHAFISKHTR